MIFLILIAAAIAAGIAYQAFGAHRDTRRFPPPGRLIDIGPCRLHLNEQGIGSPTVILESGIAATSLSWALVQPKIAEFTRVCSYDRAGLGWSEKCAAPRTVQESVTELHALLSSAQVPPPYILVGHSFGGLLIRAYANLRADEVAGLVFVDPVSLDYWADCGLNEKHRVQLGAKLSRRGAFLAQLGLVRAALTTLASGGRFFPKLIARATAGQGRGVMEGLIGEVQKLPREVWPMVRSHWSRPKCFQAMAAYLESLPASAEAAVLMPIPRHIPFVILSASNATEGELKERDSWARQGERGRHVRLAHGGHWVQLEQPDATVVAVRELVDAVRGPVS